MLDNKATRDEMELFGWPKEIEGVPESIIDRIDEADVPSFLEMYDKISDGQNTSCEKGHLFEEQLHIIAFVVSMTDEAHP